MSSSLYWADNYIEKRCGVERAIDSIKPGQRVFIGSACGEPQTLVRGLAAIAERFTGLEIIRMMSHDTASLSDVANRSHGLNLNVRNIYLGSHGDARIARNKRFITPINMSEVPALFISRKLPVNVALIQVSPPDDFGWMSLGISVDVTLAAARCAERVIAQVNPAMPRVLGQSFIHVNDVDMLVEHEEPLLSVQPAANTETANRIGQHLVRLIPNGATLQVGLDMGSQATVRALSQKNDLGFHSQYLTDDIMHLYAKGVINNRRKGYNVGKLVASAAIGSPNLYEFLHDNPAVDFHPSDYVNDPFIISRHNRMISLNVARCIDLTGQVSAQASGQTLFAGVSGIPDFVRGARRAQGGKSILMLAATSADGKKSTIVPLLADETVVVPRADVHYVATEFGVVNLFGKSLQERALALISIAHPDFREELFAAAQQADYIDPQRRLGEAGHSIYPVRLEQSFTIGEEPVIIRPAKPVDQRRIQEHYYNLDRKDVYSRFFHDKQIFSPDELEAKSQIDYIKDLTLVVVAGEVGFGKVIAVGEYQLLFDINMAEVAFSVAKAYQGKGLGRRVLHQLAAAARENGIAGLIAYTASHNRAMINLFKTLPYKIKTSFESDALCLKCRFDEVILDGGSQ